MKPIKRALLVGIDNYKNFNNLAGCVNDVNALLPLLARNEDDSSNFACMSLTSDLAEVTRRTLDDSIDMLLGPGADVALFYFAGHGSQAKGDVELATYDADGKGGGVRVSDILTKIKDSPLGEVILVLDCCFAGGAGVIPQLGEGLSLLSDGTSILAAARADQLAAEEGGRGLFSRHLCGALEGGAADVLGSVNISGVYAYLSESFGAWSQRPMFKANVDRLHELRKCDPAVPLPELRRLRDIFPSADEELPLDPSYEPDALPDDPAHEAIFAILQRCRAAKLVEPVGAEHMYFAAMQNKSCRLTPLGRHYWQIADRL